ncbi:MAG: PDZ domain-containing protein [Muribaculaceae bacterium]|nr:PDZ domain-containing protein [Muribaculaceae bacterium]
MSDSASKDGSRRSLISWLPLIGAALFCGGMWLGYLLADGDRITPAQAKLNTIFELIEEDYVDTVDMDSLVEMTIPMLLKNLDPHSVYVPAAARERANRDLESSFFGIGITFQILNDSVCVVEVVPGGPAELEGVLAGDRIVAVDGQSLIGKDIDNEAVFGLLRGPKDSPVEITVVRAGEPAPLKFNLIRDVIPSVSIEASYLMNDSVGYVRLSKFAANTHTEFLQAMTDLRYNGATCFIIDLRDNSGGLLDQAILIANELLPAGSDIVSVRGRDSSNDSHWQADGTSLFAESPLVVLVDEFTASSSEIVAGAVQDNDRGLILGRRTYGKGLVQHKIALPDSSEIRLTVQRYYTPSGRSIQKPFKPGELDEYETEVMGRIASGELFSADSVKLNSTEIFTTLSGRPVYAGGGIMPDVFVASDTTGYTSYYLRVANEGLITSFAYEYADLNRADLSESRSVDELLSKLPGHDVLLWAFVKYAADNGVPRRWYYINNSAELIVNLLTAHIARDILGVDAFYQIVNRRDPVVNEAIRRLNQGIDLSKTE